jgi:hypothetical protein
MGTVLASHSRIEIPLSIRKFPLQKEPYPPKDKALPHILNQFMRIEGLRLQQHIHIEAKR